MLHEAAGIGCVTRRSQSFEALRRIDCQYSSASPEPHGGREPALKSDSYMTRDQVSRMKMCQRRVVSCCTWGVFLGRHCVGRTADRSVDSARGGRRMRCSCDDRSQRVWRNLRRAVQALGASCVRPPARAKVVISKLCTCGIAATALRWSAGETP